MSQRVEEKDDWSAEEDRILDEGWAADEPAWKIAEKLPWRTEWAIYARARLRGFERRKRGRRKNAIDHEGRPLGTLPYLPLSQGPPPELYRRKCLSCQHEFMSTGPGNRLCDQCRSGGYTDSSSLSIPLDDYG